MWAAYIADKEFLVEMLGVSGGLAGGAASGCEALHAGVVPALEWSAAWHLQTKHPWTP